MITTVLPICALLIGGVRAWAGDEPPTAESNKAAIKLVQAYANYVWTLIAAASHKDEAWSACLQAVVMLAPGVCIVPEVGYFDFMDDNAGNDEGYRWYAGAKWQIDF